MASFDEIMVRIILCFVAYILGANVERYFANEGKDEHQ
jgi:hypothetical protein